VKQAVIAVILLVLTGCGGAADDPLPAPRGDNTADNSSEVVMESVEYTAEATLQGTVLEVRVRLRNAAESVHDLTFPDGCVVLVRVHADASRSGSPAWDQRDHAFCTMALEMVSLQPGESHTYETSVETAELRGAGLPEGELHLTAYLRPDGGEVEVPAGSVRLPD
jgi:hypothetical protein